MLQSDLNILVPIYGVILLGFVLGRFKFPWAGTELAPLVLHIALPCLVVRQLANDRARPSEMLWVMLASAIIFGVAFAISWGLLKLTRRPIRTYLAPASLNNMSVGLALGLLGFGDSGLALCIGFAAIVLLAQFSIGRICFSGLTSWKSLARQVFPWAFGLGLIFMFTHVHLPKYIDHSLELLGNLTIPLLLFSLGFALADVRFSGFWKGMLYSGIRLGMFIGVSVAIVLLLGLTGEVRTVVLLMSVLPASTISILMARQADCDMQPLTIMIACTNIWMAVALPIAIWMLLD
jgi:hypothetical protein